MADPSKSIDEFLGDVLADLVRSSGRAAKQAGRSARKGTSFNFRAGVRGSCDGELAENVTKTSGLQVKLTPGPITALKVGGEVAGGLDNARGIQANASGGLEWFAEVTIINAVALDDEDDGL